MNDYRQIGGKKYNQCHRWLRLDEPLPLRQGAIQHAIFKDILSALKTIAGANKKQATQKSQVR
jgi:hypothetical protein